MSAPKSGPSISRIKSTLSSKQLNYVLGGLSMNSAATTTTYHNVSDVAGVFHPCSSYFAKALNAKQATIEALKKEKCPKLHKYPKFILHYCMELLPLLC